jgi:hypothetical protein
MSLVSAKASGSSCDPTLATVREQELWRGQSQQAWRSPSYSPASDERKVTLTDALRSGHGDS